MRANASNEIELQKREVKYWGGFFVELCFFRNRRVLRMWADEERSR
jgi:hypothetical protein